MEILDTLRFIVSYIVTHDIKLGNFKSHEQFGYFHPSYNEFGEKCSLTGTVFFLLNFIWKTIGIYVKDGWKLNSPNGQKHT